MHLPSTVFLTAAVTFLAGLFYFFSAFMVGQLRGRHGIKAPACEGHPAFDRAYRVQLNTLEQFGIFLPMLWLAALYPIGWAWLAPLVGLVWVIARLIYRAGYMADPERRLLGAMMSGACSAILTILAGAGLVIAALDHTA